MEVKRQIESEWKTDNTIGVAKMGDAQRGRKRGGSVRRELTQLHSWHCLASTITVVFHSSTSPILFLSSLALLTNNNKR